MRTTPFSYLEGVCNTGVTSPATRLHGASCNGSAAAPVRPVPVPSAPAKAMPPPSNARRSSRPLPATISKGASPFLAPMRLRVVMAFLPEITYAFVRRKSLCSACPDVASGGLRCLPAPADTLGLTGRDIRSDRQHVVQVQFFHDRVHQRSRRPCAFAVLDHV